MSLRRILRDKRSSLRAKIRLILIPEKRYGLILTWVRSARMYSRILVDELFRYGDTKESRETSAFSLRGSGSGGGGRQGVGSRQIALLLAPSFAVALALRRWVAVAELDGDAARQDGSDVVERVHAFHLFLLDLLYLAQLDA